MSHQVLLLPLLFLLLILLLTTTVQVTGTVGTSSGSSTNSTGCETHLACDACVATEGCGWCAPSQRCLVGQREGPIHYDDDDDGDGYYSDEKKQVEEYCDVGWSFQTCQDCSMATSCVQCVHTPYYGSCMWCESTSRCVSLQPATEDICPNNDTHAASCPCGYFASNCADCYTNYCVWCVSGNTEYCREKDDTTGCTETSCESICRAMDDCASCLATSGCGWCEDDGARYCTQTAGSPSCSFVGNCANASEVDTANVGLSLSMGFLTCFGLIGVGAAVLYCRRRSSDNREFISLLKS